MMTFEAAKAVLGTDVQPDGGLYNLGHYLSWSVGDDSIVLDCRFTMEELEAILVYVKTMSGVSR